MQPETYIDGTQYEVQGTRSVVCWATVTAPFTDDEALEALTYGDYDDATAEYVVNQIVEES